MIRDGGRDGGWRRRALRSVGRVRRDDAVAALVLGPVQRLVRPAHEVGGRFPGAPLGGAVEVRVDRERRQRGRHLLEQHVASGMRVRQGQYYVTQQSLNRASGVVKLKLGSLYPELLPAALRRGRVGQKAIART